MPVRQIVTHKALELVDDLPKIPVFAAKTLNLVRRLLVAEDPHRAKTSSSSGTRSGSSSSSSLRSIAPKLLR